MRRSSGKRLIKNNQQCAHYGHHAVVCLLSGWHLEMAGRDWFLGVPFFSDQFITQTPSPHGEGKRTEQESSFLEERKNSFTDHTKWGCEVSEKQNHLQNRLLKGLAKVVV